MNDYELSDSSPFESDETAPSEGGNDSGRKFIWKGMSIAELTRHMADIRACMPSTNLEDLNVEQEMILQLHVLRELQARVISNESIQLNQRVQAAAALTKVLSDIADRQSAIYESERVKRLESALIRAVRDHLDEGAAAQFLAQYAKIAGEANA